MVRNGSREAVKNSREYKDWRELLINYLIEAGTVGKKQAEIVTKFEHHASAAVITGELEALQSEDKVQLFHITPKGGSGRKYKLWRATTKIIEN
jgi:hypothetical protein